MNSKRSPKNAYVNKIQQLQRLCSSTAFINANGLCEAKGQADDSQVVRLQLGKQCQATVKTEGQNGDGGKSVLEVNNLSQGVHLHRSKQGQSEAGCIIGIQTTNLPLFTQPTTRDEIRLKKNRESARKARQRKRYYLQLLEVTVKCLKQLKEKLIDVKCESDAFLNKLPALPEASLMHDYDNEQRPNESSFRLNSLVDMDKIMEQICQLSVVASLKNLKLPEQTERSTLVPMLEAWKKQNPAMKMEPNGFLSGNHRLINSSQSQTPTEANSTSEREALNRKGENIKHTQQLHIIETALKSERRQTKNIHERLVRVNDQAKRLMGLLRQETFLIKSEPDIETEDTHTFQRHIETCQALTPSMRQKLLMLRDGKDQTAMGHINISQTETLLIRMRRLTAAATHELRYE